MEVKGIILVASHSLCIGQYDHPGLDGIKDQPVQDK